MKKTRMLICPVVTTFLNYGLLLSGVIAGQTTDDTPSPTAMKTGDAPRNIEFSSAVHLASSISWSLHQLSTIPALPLPTNITAVPAYEIVSRLAPALPPIQVGASFGDVDDMIAGMIAATNVSSPDKSIVGRQSTLRVMVVGDSMSQGMVLC